MGFRFVGLGLRVCDSDLGAEALGIRGLPGLELRESAPPPACLIPLYV